MPLSWRSVSSVTGLVAVLAIAALVYCNRDVGEVRLEPHNATTELDKPADDGSALPPQVAAALQAVVADKSAALDRAQVAIQRAYEYRGPTTIIPQESAKCIAVDATFSGYTDRFKIWDIDIIDAKTNENFGSDPDVAFLDNGGEFLSFRGDQIDFTKPIRLLMVFAVPKSTTAITLGYWGRDLALKSVTLEDGGPALPKRE